MGSEINAPHLDSLAKNGILFTQAYNTAKCFPTRACLLTGKWFQEIRNARYQRQIETGLIDPKIAPLSPPEYDQPWESLSTELKQRRIAQMEVYAAMIERMDENIGRVIDLLDQQGRLENTINFFLTDNGACATDLKNRVGNYRDDAPIGGVDRYEAYHQGWACVSNTPLRRFKTNRCSAKEICIGNGVAEMPFEKTI